MILDECLYPLQRRWGCGVSGTLFLNRLLPSQFLVEATTVRKGRARRAFTGPASAGEADGESELATEDGAFIHRFWFRGDLTEPLAGLGTRSICRAESPLRNPRSAFLDAAIAVGMLIAEHPPAQIPACVFHAPGSHLGYLPSRGRLRRSNISC